MFEAAATAASGRTYLPGVGVPISERDMEPSARAARRRGMEEQRKREREAAEQHRYELMLRANRNRDGHDRFVQMWDDAEARFVQDREERSLVQRCLRLLGEKIEPREHPRILIVADHPVRLAFYTELLHMVGCHVVCTRVASHGVSLAAPLQLRAPGTEFDLIIMDRPRHASDSAAAQAMQDFAYSVRIRDAAYRKEQHVAVCNKFLFVLGETDAIAPFVIQTGASYGQDIACIRRPLYYHLAVIRRLILPSFISSHLRLKLYRQDPNYDKILRMLQPPEAEAMKRKREIKALMTSDKNDDGQEDDGKAETPDAAHIGDEGGGGPSGTGSSSGTAAGGKSFVTFESLLEENDHLHNVIVSHLRTKSRLEESLKESEQRCRDLEERFRFAIQGLEGQLRDKDAEMSEVLHVAKEMRTKLHELQVREAQLVAQNNVLNQRRAKKAPAGSEGSGALGAAEPVDGSAPPPPLAQHSGGTATEVAQTVQVRSSALASQLDEMLQKEAERKEKRTIVLQLAKPSSLFDAAKALEAKLHVVEINSKPIQCDIWYQSPAEQMEVAKLFAAQFRTPGKRNKDAGRKDKGPAAARSTEKQAESHNSPDTSRAQSRQLSRQGSSRGSRGSGSGVSDGDEFEGSPFRFGDGGSPFESIFADGGDEHDMVTTLRVENNALRKQVQFFKMQRSMSLTASGVPPPPPHQRKTSDTPTMGYGAVALPPPLPTAELVVPDGMKDVQYLHKKIALLSQEVARLEGALVAQQAARISSGTFGPQACGTSQEDSQGSRDVTAATGAGGDAVGLTSPLSDSIGAASAAAVDAPPRAGPPQPHSSGGERGEDAVGGAAAMAAASGTATAAAAAAASATILALREKVSRLEYKVHSLDLHRITCMMQKLVYKGAMLRLLDGEATAPRGAAGFGVSAAGSGATGMTASSAPARKVRTKETSTNTDAVATAGPAAQPAWDSMFSPQEMEARVGELGTKLREANTMFKEAKDQHLQSERRALELKLELEKLHAAHAEVNEVLRGTKRQLGSTEEINKAFREKVSALEKAIVDLKQEVDSKDTVIAALKVRPLTVVVGTQTKVSGDVKRSTGALPATGGASGTAHPVGLRAAMQHMLRGDNPDGHDKAVTPSVTPRGVIDGPSVPLWDAQETAASLETKREELTSAATVDSSQNALESTVIATAPTDDEIKYLVTTRMAALALYSAAQVDGSDVPRKEHDSIVNRLKKECADYVSTITKLNDVRNAQRAELAEMRGAFREMRENKSSVPELRAMLEEKSNELETEKKNAAMRERLMRKNFDLMRLKYHHLDDQVAMAAFDVDSFAIHTLKATMDLINDRSIEYLCAGVEFVLGAARRLIAQLSNVTKPHYADAPAQTTTFVLQNPVVQKRRSFAADADDSPTSPDASPTQGKGRRRSSVSILDAQQQQQQQGSSNGPKSSSGGSSGVSGAANAAVPATGSLLTKRKGTLSTTYATKMEELDIKPLGPAVVKEVQDAEMQTVKLPRLAVDVAVECALVSQPAPLPPRRQAPVSTTKLTKTKVAGSSSSAAAVAPVPGSTAELTTTVFHASSDSTTHGVTTAHGIEHDHIPNRIISSPSQRTSLLHTPGSRSHSSRLQHRRQDGDLGEGCVDGGGGSSVPSSAILNSTYETVSLVETKNCEVQTVPMLTEAEGSMNAAESLLSYLEGLDGLSAALNESVRGNCSTNVMGESVSVSESPNHRSAALAKIVRETLQSMLFNELEQQQQAEEDDYLARASPQAPANAGATLVPHQTVPHLSISSVDSPGRHSRMPSVRDHVPSALHSARRLASSSGRLPPPAAPLGVEAEAQTDPVIVQQPFSVFHGDFHHAETLKTNLAVPLRVLSHHQIDAGTQYDCAEMRDEGESSSDDEAVAATTAMSDEKLRADRPTGQSDSDRREGLPDAAAEGRLMVAAFRADDIVAPADAAALGGDGLSSSAAAASDSAPAPVPQRKKRRYRAVKAVKVAELGCQTDPDTNPSKAIASFIAVHQALIRLAMKLRGPLCLGSAVAPAETCTAVLLTAPSVRCCVEASARDCHLVDLMMEKLAVAFRSLKNSGLHGVDFTIASLNLLVGDTQAQDAREPSSSALRPLVRHMDGGGNSTSTAHPSTSAALHPSLGYALGNVTAAPLTPPSRLPPLAAVASPGTLTPPPANIAIFSAEGVVQLPPIRAIDEVLLSQAPPHIPGPGPQVHQRSQADAAAALAKDATFGQLVALAESLGVPTSSKPERQAVHNKRAPMPSKGESLQRLGLVPPRLAAKNTATALR